MTSEAERRCYYHYARQMADEGAIVELGAWLGASTAAIAAGIRDSGVQTRAHVYDRFKLNTDHLRKAKGLTEGPCLEQFKANLGPLMAYVEPHKGEIADLEWDDEPISVLICDAPKRVPQISSVLTKFAKALQPGSIMAWQDFCHFPSYEIPACLYRIREHLEFVEAVVPGTTLVFRVNSQWTAEEVSLEALALGKWTPEEITRAWDDWLEDKVPSEKSALFACGEAMFLCDSGQPALAVERLTEIFTYWQSAIVKKWRYLRETRPDFLTRYQPLFEYLERQGVFEKETA